MTQLKSLNTLKEYKNYRTLCLQAGKLPTEEHIVDAFKLKNVSKTLNYNKGVISCGKYALERGKLYRKVRV